jgi:molybdopterin molybdotransferase
MASQQRSFPAVYRRPSVAILSTGDELAEIDQPVEKGHIVTSNTYGLAALALANGAVPRMLPIAPDDQNAIRQAVESALEADFILSSGGVSVGEYDFIKKVLDDMGAEPKLWRVAMKPGKPLFFSLLQGKPYFGLPGNPISSLMSFLQFVRPAVRKAAGHPQDRLLLPQARAVLDQTLENDGDRRQYMRARLRRQEGRLHAAVQASQGSHILTSMLGANGIVVLAPYERVEAGQQAQVQLIGPVA